MNERMRALYAKMAEAAQAADEIRDRYKGNDEPFSAEDEEALDRAYADYDKFEKAFNDEKRGFELEQKRREPASGVDHPASKDDDDEETRMEKHMGIFDKFLRGGEKAVNAEELAYLKNFTADDSVEGGYITAPGDFVNRLLKDVDDAVVIRTLSTVYMVEKAESLGVPTLEDDMSDPEWTAELGTPTVDADLSFGSRELFPHQLTKEAKVSRKLLRRAIMPVEALVRERMAYRFGITLENAYMNGTGDRQPLGLFVASSAGIPTTRDVNTGASADFTADGLINAKHELKPQYWGSARWLFHRYSIRNIRKLKDGDGSYIWQSGIQSDLPPNILEVPYVVSEYAPSTFSNGNYAGMIGDFSYYWIVDARDFGVQVLNELYARTDQTGFIGRLETDGMPVLPEAFIRLKFAS